MFRLFTTGRRYRLVPGLSEWTCKNRCHVSRTRQADGESDSRNHDNGHRSHVTYQLRRHEKKRRNYCALDGCSDGLRPYHPAFTATRSLSESEPKRNSETINWMLILCLINNIFSCFTMGPPGRHFTFIQSLS